MSGPRSITRELHPTIGSTNSKKNAKHKSENEKTKISIKFIQKLSQLGIPEYSAADMAELKINWNAVIAKNGKDFKIHCTEPKCHFRAHMTPDSLRNHCITMHEWGEYKCPRTDNCKYVSHTKESGHFMLFFL